MKLRITLTDIEGLISSLGNIPINDLKELLADVKEKNDKLIVAEIIGKLKKWINALGSATIEIDLDNNTAIVVPREEIDTSKTLKVQRKPTIYDTP